MLVGAFAAVAGACGSSPALRAARAGDFPSLQKDVAAEEKVGQLSNGEAATLASAVAAWEIASGPKDEQLARVREARGCARDLDGALASRMKTRDPAGAEAALARVEAGEMSAGDARDYAQDADDAWRAVGARGLVREDDDAARQKAYVDPAPAVRRAAMHAARIAKDPRDVETLAEAARVDPEPIVRTDAVRALAAIGGASVVPKLRDLWASADEPLREDIASAWGAAAVWGAGGATSFAFCSRRGAGRGRSRRPAPSCVGRTATVRSTRQRPRSSRASSRKGLAAIASTRSPSLRARPASSSTRFTTPPRTRR